jgi:hypothetical protein
MSIALRDRLKREADADGSSIDGDQEAGGARGWNAVVADSRWLNSASVVR